MGNMKDILDPPPTIDDESWSLCERLQYPGWTLDEYRALCLLAAQALLEAERHDWRQEGRLRQLREVIGHTLLGAVDGLPLSESTVQQMQEAIQQRMGECKQCELKNSGG